MHQPARTGAVNTEAEESVALGVLQATAGEDTAD
jgi:hypothetical protein